MILHIPCAYIYIYIFASIDTMIQMHLYNWNIRIKYVSLVMDFGHRMIKSSVLFPLQKNVLSSGDFRSTLQLNKAIGACARGASWVEAVYLLRKGRTPRRDVISGETSNQVVHRPRIS